MGKIDMSWKLIVGLVLTTTIWRLDVIASLLAPTDEPVQVSACLQSAEARF